MIRLLLFLSSFWVASNVASQSVDSQPQSIEPQSTSPARLTAKDWLDRLNTLVSTKNFEAKFVLYRLGDETVPYLWRHGVMENGTHMEQLNLQNGPGKEYIRVGDKVSVFEPEVLPYTVIGTRINGPIPWALLHNDETLYDAYQFVVVGRARISGRPAQQIRVVSLDNTRFSYRIWLDEETGMLLKFSMLDTKGKVLEQVQMSAFSFSEKPHSYFAKVNQGKLPRLMVEAPKQNVKQNWNISFLPVGFKEIKRDRRQLSMDGRFVDYRLYSDGLVDISIYIEPAEQSLNTDILLRHELSTFLSRTSANSQITIIGEVPPETANAIVSSIEWSVGP